jgi:hypothetical protein
MGVAPGASVPGRIDFTSRPYAISNYRPYDIGHKRGDIRARARFRNCQGSSSALGFEEDQASDLTGGPVLLRAPSSTLLAAARLPPTPEDAAVPRRQDETSQLERDQLYRHGVARQPDPRDKATVSARPNGEPAPPLASFAPAASTRATVSHTPTTVPLLVRRSALGPVEPECRIGLTAAAADPGRSCPSRRPC